MIIAIATLLDDIYDSYATPEECEILTQCIERFVLLITNTFIILGSQKLMSIFNVNSQRTIKKNNNICHFIQVISDLPFQLIQQCDSWIYIITHILYYNSHTEIRMFV
jgi:hypothetical protein